MQKTLPSSLLLAGALLASASASAAPMLTTYNTTITQACTYGCSGNMSANATIVANALGTLTAANIVDWNIVLNGPNTGSFTLTPANSTK